VPTVTSSLLALLHLLITTACLCTQKALGCRSFELFDIVDAAADDLEAIHGIGLDDYCNS
jgi:hypothetical protein